MGLKTSTGQAKWIQLTRGVFILNENGTKTSYPALEATLVGIGFRDTEFEGKKKREVVCTFSDNGEQFKLSLDSEGGYGRQLLLKMMNADITQPLELTPTYSDDGGKKTSGMFVSQHGSQLKQRYTRDNPGDMPPPETTTFAGKQLSDFSAQRRFIEDFIMQHIAPIAAKNATHSSSHDRTSQGDAHAGDNQDHNPEDGSGIPDDDSTTPF